jgi:tetratricopeptide (TPR) repeat protein
LELVFAVATATPRATASPGYARTLTPAIGVRVVGVAIGHELSDPTPAERAALAEDVELPEPVRKKLLAMARLVDKHDPHALLGVPHGADAKALKRAYFMLSKEVHPDRYYGKRLGSFAERLTAVFEATSRAYATLTGGDRSRASGGRAAVTVQQDQPQTPQEYAAELFERACGLEVGGDALGAMKLFAAAVRVDAQPRYLRRASSCALAAEQPKTAVEYAKKAYAMAPGDASSARLLASAFRAAGKLSDAEEVLVMAMALKNENDVLTAELRHDLADVRRLIAAAQ